MLYFAPFNTISGGLKLVQGQAQSRTDWLRRGEFLAALTVSYNLAEGFLAITAGLLAGSAALSGFGFDSVIEVTSAALLWWRLRAERRQRAREGAEKLERTASRIAGALLLLLSVVIGVEAVRQFWAGKMPSTSGLGIALTTLSLVVMPILARAKLRTAEKLGSRALRADAHETIACAWLSGTTLAGLVLNAAFDWWWADPAAALLLVPLIAREGWEAWQGEDECGGEDS